MVLIPAGLRAKQQQQLDQQPELQWLCLLRQQVLL
jgi:hypothetical protein